MRACWLGLAILYPVLRHADPEGIEATIYSAFPGLQAATFIGNSLGLIGNSALLVGAFMSFFYHPHGRAVVRITIWIMIGVGVLTTAFAVNSVVSSSAWETLDAPRRGALLGGIVGAAIGGVLQGGLILFLFRNRQAN
jgi:hypothetical protein